MAEIAIFTSLILFPLSGLMLVHAQHTKRKASYKMRKFRENYERIRRGGRRPWRQ